MRSTLAIIAFATLVLLVACGKDKFESKPRLEFKDYNSKEIFKGQTLRIRLNYFDKEGDLNTGNFLGIRVRLNKLPPPIDLADTFRYNLPQFPPKDQGEITYELNWDFLKEDKNPPPLGQNDTVQFKFAVTDLAGNKSDTIVTEPVVIFMEQ